MTIWFDIDNSPHVLLFAPIIKVLKEEGFNVLVTTRDFAQTLPLLEKNNIEYIRIDGYSGKNKLSKLYQTLTRAIKLAKAIKGYKVDLLVNHGARAGVLAAWMLNKKIISGFDYEYTELFILKTFSDIILVPLALQQKFNSDKYHFYNGLKEQVYLCDFIPDPDFKRNLPFKNVESKPLVVLRPPAFTANYYDSNSLNLFTDVLGCLKNLDCNIVYLPRMEQDKDFVKSFDYKLFIPPNPLDGPNLVYYADVVISGGGTMLREAAVLGTRSYSIFTGKPAQIDIELVNQGKLIFIRCKDDIKKIDLSKQNKKTLNSINSEIRNFFINIIKQQLK
ncbi:MAG: DUF354 domain-containing protein [Ignavibacteria bacterium]